MDSAFIALGYSDPYYKSQLNKYLVNKPHEDEYKKDLEIYMKKAYELAKPSEHTFNLTKTE